MNSDNHILSTDKDNSNVKKILQEVYAILNEKGYNPIGQIVGYLLSEDPTYITNCDNARTLIHQIDRDALMMEMVKSYLELN